MFAIYNNNGLNYRSTVDNLYTTSNIDAIARSKNNVEEGLPKDHSTKPKKRLYENNQLNEAADIYKSIANIDTKAEIFHVKDLMTRDVFFLNKSNTLQDAYNLMESEDIRQVPIVDEENDNKIIAMINQKHILNSVLNDLEFVNTTLRRPLGSFDLGDVITADPITDIRRVAKVMVDFSLTAIAIVDQEENLLGIVSRANILKAVANTPPLQIWG